MSQFLINPYRFVVAPQFASLYESFQALTILQKQHFVEWFSGKAWDSIFTLRDITGTGSLVMNDIVNGGARLSTGANSSDESMFSFNDIRHYAHNAAVVIAVNKRVGATTFSGIGMTDDQFNITSNQFNMQDDTGDTFKNLTTANGTSGGATNTDVAIDTNFHVNKTILGVSTVEYFIEGVTKATRSTLLPTGKMQPAGDVFARASGGKSMDIRFYEAFNT